MIIGKSIDLCARVIYFSSANNEMSSRKTKKKQYFYRITDANLLAINWQSRHPRETKPENTVVCISVTTVPVTGEEKTEKGRRKNLRTAAEFSSAVSIAAGVEFNSHAYPYAQTQSGFTRGRFKRLFPFSASVSDV